MNKRLQQFLTAENISQSQFADTIGVAKASVSHILAGRNKPGFEFIEGMMRHYPDLNLEWFISGKGKMYKNPSSELQQASSYTPLPQKIEASTESDLFAASEMVEDTPAIEEKPSAELSYSKKESSGKPRIVKIMAFYDDGTYKELE